MRAILVYGSVGFSALLLSMFCNIHQTSAPSSCTVNVNTPMVNTIHSGRPGPPLVGERLIIGAGIVSSGCKSELQLIGIIEVRSPDGITEFINQETFTMYNQTSMFGTSWVPLQYGVHQLRFFALDSFADPTIVSNIAITNLPARAYQPLVAAISILPEPYQPNKGPDFLPQNITVVVGVNNTVSWTNGDNSAHALIGQQVLGGNDTIKFSPSAYIDSDYSSEFTFTSPGMYEYKDKDNPRMFGSIQVLPEHHIQAVNVTIPEGSNIGNGPNYEPQLVRLVIGQNNTVTWTNDSNETNGVWADSQYGDDPQFYEATHSTTTNQSNVIKPHQSFTYTFTIPGIIQYHGHSFLSGTVIVLPAASDNKLEYSFYDGQEKVPSNQIIHQNYTGLDQNNGIVSIGNQSFYMTTLNTTSGIAPFESVPFHGVQFTFPNGENYTPGGSSAVLRIDFPDGSEEVIGKQVTFEDGAGYGSGIAIVPLGPSNGWNMTATTILTNHIMPQAGVTVIPGQDVKLLVSTQ